MEVPCKELKELKVRVEQIEEIMAGQMTYRTHSGNTSSKRKLKPETQEDLIKVNEELRKKLSITNNWNESKQRTIEKQERLTNQLKEELSQLHYVHSELLTKYEEEHNKSCRFGKEIAKLLNHITDLKQELQEKDDTIEALQVTNKRLLRQMQGWDNDIPF